MQRYMDDQRTLIVENTNLLLVRTICWKYFNSDWMCR